MKSPLRYPGGKSRYIKKILPHIPADKTIASPFFGGGHIELACMGRNQQVIGGDAFVPLANFWTWAFNETLDVAQKCKQGLSVTDKRRLFNQCRVMLQSTEYTDRTYSAAAYFVVNRCSFSGATLSGGFSESAAEYRYTKSSVDRVFALQNENLKQFHLCDFRMFVSDYAENAFLYCDPPYYEIDGLYGSNGDMSFGIEDHQDLAEILKNYPSGWALSYNDCPQIRELYQGFEFITLKPSSSMSNGKKSCPEVLILNRWK